MQPPLTRTGTQPYRKHWSAPAAGPRRLSGPAAQSSHSHQYHTASRPRTDHCQVGRSGRRRRRHLHSAVSKNVRWDMRGEYEPVGWSWKSNGILMVLSTPAAPMRTAPQMRPWGLGLQGSLAWVGIAWATEASRARAMDVVRNCIFDEAKVGMSWKDRGELGRYGVREWIFGGGWIGRTVIVRFIYFSHPFSTG